MPVASNPAAFLDLSKSQHSANWSRTHDPTHVGLHVCGGKGKHSRKTPQELRGIAERVGVDGEALQRTSWLVAKVDSAAVQDGFDLYLHGFIVADDGKWTVVQQGMNADARQARSDPHF